MLTWFKVTNASLLSAMRRLRTYTHQLNKVHPDSIDSYLFPLWWEKYLMLLLAPTRDVICHLAAVGGARCMKPPGRQLMESVRNLENYRLCKISKICTRYEAKQFLHGGYRMFRLFNNSLSFSVWNKHTSVYLLSTFFIMAKYR